MRPPAPILHALAEARARIFQTTPPRPLGESPSIRTGAKYLKKRLVGPSMLAYYPPTVSLKPLNKALYGPGGPHHGETWQAPDGTTRTGLIDLKELQRLKDIEHKKSVGKGPPKKGKRELTFVLICLKKNTDCHLNPLEPQVKEEELPEERVESGNLSLCSNYCTISKYDFLKPTYERYRCEYAKRY